MAFEVLTNPALLAYVALGVFLGIVVGAIPGLTGAMLIALSLPLTFGMEAAPALALLVAMYVGSVSGGLISATLLGMPGTPASIITTLDGYPMAKSGNAGRALALGIGASFVGGIVSWVVLASLARPIAEFSTQLGPFEFLALVILALVLVAGVSGDSLARGAFAACLGMLCTIPGTTPGTGQPRMTFGLNDLDAGFELLPVLIGLFAMSRILAGPQDHTCEEIGITGQRLRVGWRSWKGQSVNLARSSAIGTGVGILPGIGANIGSLISYSTARGLSKTPETFGTGSEEGIVASESANNATVGGALIPLISLGIPGSVIDAILLGAFVIHGLQPGPTLFQNDPVIVDTIGSAFLFANLAMVVLMLLSVRWIARLADVPNYLLTPIIAVFCIVGSYALANRYFDVWVMLGFGVLGLLFDRFRIPAAPFVMGFVLFPIAEEHLVAGVTQTGGSLLPLVTRPGSITILLVAGGLLWWSLRGRKQKPKTSD